MGRAEDALGPRCSSLTARQSQSPPRALPQGILDPARSRGVPRRSLPEVAGASGLGDRHAAAMLVVVEIVCVLLLLFGNRLPVAALTGLTTAVLAPANGILRWVEGVATAKSEATRLRSEIASLRMEQGRLVDSKLEQQRLRTLLGFTAP